MNELSRNHLDCGRKRGRNQMDVGFMGWLNGLKGKWMSQGYQLIHEWYLVNLEFYVLNQN